MDRGKEMAIACNVLAERERSGAEMCERAAERVSVKMCERGERVSVKARGHPPQRGTHAGLYWCAVHTRGTQIKVATS